MARDRRFVILFTPEEYQEIVWLAECDSGIKRKKTQEKNVSAYIRKCIFDKNDNPAAIKKELRDLSYQVRKIGVNINQVVTKINAGYAVPVDIDNLLIYLKKVEEEFLRLENNLKEREAWQSQN